MAYEIFSKRITRTNPPAVTIGTNGRLGLNKAAAELLSKDLFDHVLLMWDAQERKVAIRPIKKKDPRAYRINFSKNAGAGIAAKSFCEYIGYDYANPRKFAAHWNDSESAIEIDLNRTDGKQEKPEFEVHKRRA